MNITITLNDGTYKYLTEPSKRKIAGLISRLRGKSGTCRVTYDMRGFYNEFDFNSEDLKHKLEPCIEDDLINQYKRS